MPGYKVSYPNSDDGCTYCIDEHTGKIIKICTVPIEQVPESVRARMRADKERLAILAKVDA
jgi:hypothetical protein